MIETCYRGRRWESRLLVRPGMVTPLAPSTDNSVPWAETEAARAATRSDWERILNEGFELRETREDRSREGGFQGLKSSYSRRATGARGIGKESEKEV